MSTAAIPSFGCTCARLRKLTRRLTRTGDELELAPHEVVRIDAPLAAG